MVFVVVVVVEQGRKHFVFLILVADFYVSTKHENIYEIQLVRNSSLLNVIFVVDQVHVYVNVEYKAICKKINHHLSRCQYSTYLGTFRSEFHLDDTRCWSFP